MNTSVEQIQRDPLSASEAEMQALIDSAEHEEQDVEGAPSGAEVDPGSKKDPIVERAATPAERDEWDPRNVSVRTADGKHEIPYTAFEGARSRAREATAARQAAEEQANLERGQRLAVERQLADLQAQLAETRANPAAAPTTPDDEATMTAEEMEALQEEAPNLYRILKATQESLSKLKQDTADAKTRAEQAENSVLANARNSVQAKIEDVIANSPKIAFLRETDTDRYNAIVDIDRFLLTQPQSQNLPIPERIAKALSMYEAGNGVVQLPGKPTQAGKTAATPAAPAAAISEASAPHTLSDIPGGGLPATNEMDNVDALTQRQIEQKMSRMTQEQIFEYVGKLSL